MNRGLGLMYADSNRVVILSVTFFRSLFIVNIYVRNLVKHELNRFTFLSFSIAFVIYFFNVGYARVMICYLYIFDVYYLSCVVVCVSQCYVVFCYN